LKNGAAFVCGDRYTDFDFSDKHTPGWGTTFQVPRAPFDKLLADEAQRLGTEIRYRHEILDADFSGERPRLTVRNPAGEIEQYQARFVLDASGYGRVLPRLLNLETPSSFPVRRAVFTHIEDNIVAEEFDRKKIRVTIHPQNHDVWYWLIPFSNGRSSIGVVAKEDFYERFADRTPDELLKSAVGEDPVLSHLLRNAGWDTPAREIVGYSANVKALCGRNFALLGNAGEFLDPVFSSGVTIAMKSASLAVDLLTRQFQGEPVDWEKEYAQPLMKGVDTFRTYVQAWYDGRFQEVIFHPRQPASIKSQISSILAGYAWDETNPFVNHANRRLEALRESCRADLH
jgi:flavin-dependent dehydrogenase